MSKYAYKVEIEGILGFVLDTDLLDTGLLGYLATDITSYVRSVSVKTGRSTIQDKFTAGQMSVVLDNRARVFDPNYVDSPLYGVAVPRRKMLFSIQPEPEATFVPVFDGFIDSWAYDYDVSGDSTASVSCSDAFTILANQTLTLTNPPAEKTGLRFTRALTSSSVAWPAANIVYTGDAFTMGTASYSGDVLSYLQELADSERGYLTVNYYDGVAVTLYGWNYFNAFDAAAIFSDDTSIANSIPFTNIETSYDTDQFYNYVSVTGYPGTVVSQDTTSQTDYGIAAGEFPVLQSGTAQMGVVANYIVESSKSPPNGSIFLSCPRAQSESSRSTHQSQGRCASSASQLSTPERKGA